MSARIPFHEAVRPGLPHSIGLKSDPTCAQVCWDSPDPRGRVRSRARFLSGTCVHFYQGGVNGKGAGRSEWQRERPRGVGIAPRLAESLLDESIDHGLGSFVGWVGSSVTPECRSATIGSAGWPRAQQAADRGDRGKLYGAVSCANNRLACGARCAWALVAPGHREWVAECSVGDGWGWCV